MVKAIQILGTALRALPKTMYNCSSSLVSPHYYLFSRSRFWLNSDHFFCGFLKVMECLSSILGLAPCLYDCTSKRAVYIRDLKENLEALRKAEVELNTLYEDVRRRVALAEQQLMERRNEVDGWLNEVENMVKEVDEMLQKGGEELHGRCLRSCPGWNCWSSYKIGTRICEKLNAVSIHINKGHFHEVADTLPRPRVDRLPMEETVGSDFIYERICSCVRDEKVGILGLYGMGGVGKTTLLKKINNNFLTTSTDFDVVIWVVVTKSPNIEKIQKVIWNKLQIPRDTWETRSSEDEKAAEILIVLNTKKFVLLLDDIWERLDLHELGVPHPDAQNKSKIIFTSRSKDVCHQMQAQKSVEVVCLEAESAWTLFRKEVGEETLNSHPHIPGLAKFVAKECKGLPLALVTLGRAMASVKDPSEWDKVTKDLQNFPAEISVVEKLFCHLKLSYDRLRDSVIKSCFLYCSFPPEDCENDNHWLIDLWIGEGFLGEPHDIHEARNQGLKIIKDLKQACLLESCGSRERWVKMHDVIHGMALWLYSERGMKQNKILVYDEVCLNEAQEISKWRETEKMWLENTNVESLATLVCPNLETLIAKRCNKLETFPSGFFQFMPLLRVLDLSWNVNLIELPAGIGKLDALRYLNLSATRIRELPIEVQNLKHLVCLLMLRMKSLEIIQQDVISSLTSLRLFGLNVENGLSVNEKPLLGELESLNDISEISISISSAISLEKLKSSHKLQKCLTGLYLYELQGSLELSSSLIKRMEHFLELHIHNCFGLKEVKINVKGKGMQGFGVAGEEYFRNLRVVNIRNCPELSDLTWLVYAPYLDTLYVKHCRSIEEVIHHDDSGASEIKEKLGIFSRLKYLKFRNLPSLKSICRHPLRLPSLEIMKVYRCQGLRGLPFDSNTSKNNLKKIEGETIWWNQLQWNDVTVKHAFTPYFQSKRAETHAEKSEAETYSEESSKCQVTGSTDGVQEQSSSK